MAFYACFFAFGIFSMVFTHIALVVNRYSFYSFEVLPEFVDLCKLVKLKILCILNMEEKRKFIEIGETDPNICSGVR